MPFGVFAHPQSCVHGCCPAMLRRSTLLLSLILLLPSNSPRMLLLCCSLLPFFTGRNARCLGAGSPPPLRALRIWKTSVFHCTKMNVYSLLFCSASLSSSCNSRSLFFQVLVEAEPRAVLDVLFVGSSEDARKLGSRGTAWEGSSTTQAAMQMALRRIASIRNA